MRQIQSIFCGLLWVSLLPVAVCDPIQKAGAGLEAKVSTGYGLYAVTMKACGQKGAISSFYTYAQNGVWTTRWHEIDLEFTPGFAGLGKGSADKYHSHTLATGDLY